MPDPDRRARIERAKALGRAAYRLARTGELVGNVEVDGEEKRLHEFRRGLLFIDLYEPFRSTAAATEFSRLRVTYSGVKVLELRWCGAGTFNVVKFERGEWERLITS